MNAVKILTDVLSIKTPENITVSYSYFMGKSVVMISKWNDEGILEYYSEDIKDETYMKRLECVVKSMEKEDESI